MRYVSPYQHQKRLRLNQRRLRRHCLKALRRRGGARPEKVAYHHLRRRRPVVNAGLFADSAAGIEPILVERSFHYAPSGEFLACIRLKAPEDFRLSSNQYEVMRFIYEMRRQVFVKERFRGKGTSRRPGLYIDLDHIKHIDLETALVLAAEFDRVRRALGMRPILDDGNWDPTVRWLLHGLGLYDVIEAHRRGSAEPIADFKGPAAMAGVTVIPFLSCTKADPAKALELRSALYKHCVPGDDETKLAVYDSLVEAFNNAVTHAYLDDFPGDGLPRLRRWWAGALVDHRDGYLHLVVYDQGLGIPTTLPARKWWNLIKLQLPELTDAAVLAGALSYGRSGTAENEMADADGRGNGLWRMCELAETFEYADVRFTSLKGEVLYVKGGRVEQAILPSRFCGTLIRWRAKIGEGQEP